MIRGFLKGNINRVLLLEVTAYPGFYRVLILFLIKYIFSTQTVGNFVNDTAYAIIFGFFTCVNFANYILKDIPSLTGDDKKRFLNIVVIESLKYSLFFSLIGLVLYYYGFIVESYGFFIYMIFNSLYTILRFYYIVEKNYWPLVIIEFFLLAFSILALYVFPAKYVVLGNSLCFVFFTVAVVAHLKLYKYLRPSAELKKLLQLSLTLNYGFINVTASGLYMLLAPLSFQLLSPLYTALVGIVSNVIQVLLLFTRSVSYHYSPMLAKSKNDILQLRRYQAQFKNKLNLLLSVGFILCAAGVFIWSKMGSKNVDLLSLKGSIVITTLFLLTLTTSQVSLAASSLLVILNKAALILRPNIYQTVAFFAIGIILYEIHAITPIVLFEALLVVLILSNLYKYYYLNREEALLLKNN